MVSKVGINKFFAKIGIKIYTDKGYEQDLEKEIIPPRFQ